MAIYHLNVKVISRGKSHSAVAAAAYRARDVLHDERTGETHDYSRMTNRALFAGLFVPKDAPDWAHDRETLWNAAEKAETDFNRKKNTARVAKDITVALPHEMTDRQREWLVKDFVREQFQRKGYAVDVAIHEPHEQGDRRNYHAHILVSERVLSRDGFAKEKDRHLIDKATLRDAREKWAELANRHLERHGLDARIDHRKLEAQGIDREPTMHMGKDATAAQRKGRRTERGDRAEAITARNDERHKIQAEIKTVEQEQRTYERPANATAAKIHEARFASDSGKAFAAALEEHGLQLAQVTDNDLAQVNHNRREGWRPIATGDYVAVNQRGQVYELTERNTGLTRVDRANWLHDLDGTLAGVAETQAAREAERLTQQQERRAARTRRQDTTQELGESAALITSTAGKMLGGVVKGVLEPLLGALADFFTGGSSPPPIPSHDAPAPAPMPERTPADRLREQGRVMALETPTLDPQTAAIRRFQPLAIAPEKEAHIQRLQESQAKARQRENERDGDDRER